MPYESKERIIAPWTPDQKDSLAAYQEKIFSQQAYYCDFASKHPPLVVTEFNMVCSECGKKVFWAFGIACNWDWQEKLRASNESVTPIAKRFSGGATW